MSDEIKILKVTKKKKNFIISTNDIEYIFDEDSLIEFGIFKDQVFTKSRFIEILAKRDANKAFNSALYFLGLGVKSISEVKKHLENKDIDASIIDDTVKRLSELGYLNDYTYARNILQYYKNNNKGPQYIINKLYEKKVSRKIIDEVIEDYSDESEIQEINNIIAKEELKLRDYPIIKQRQVISNKLIRNGFTPDIVFSIIKDYELIDDSDNRLLLEVEKQKRLLADKQLTDYQKKQKIIQSLINKGYEYYKISSLLE